MAADVFRTARVSPYLQRDNFSVATLRTVLAGRSTQDRLLLGEMRAALEQQHGGFCSEKLCRYSLQLCRNAISGTRARSLLLLLGLRHVLFTLVYLISWLKRCMALAGLPHSGSC